MKDKNQEIETLKRHAIASNKHCEGIEAKYNGEIKQFIELNMNLKHLCSVIPAADQLKEWRTKIDDLTKENEKLRKEVKQLQTQGPGKKSTQKTGKKSATKDKNDKASGLDSLESPNSLLQSCIEQAEKYNSVFVKDLTQEYYLLELEFEEYKSATETQVKRLETDLRDRDDEVRMLRKEIVSLRNQKETVIFDVAKGISYRATSPAKTTQTSTLYLGKSPVPRGQIYDANTPSSRFNTEESKLGDSRVKKRIADIDGKVREFNTEVRNGSGEEHHIGGRSAKISALNKHKYA